MNQKTITRLIIFIFLSTVCISHALYAQDDHVAYQGKDDQDRRSKEIVKQWEQVQEENPMIATMLIESVTILMMAEEKEISVSWLSDIGKCFSGLLSGQIVDRTCMFPMELVKLPCPCPDPQSDCDPNWNPKTYWKCVKEAFLCRLENSTLCP
jgi:hypothetical protein